MTAVEQPQRIVDILVGAGWKVEASGVRTILAHRNSSQELMVPMDPDAPEYGELLDTVARQLTRAVSLGDAARQVLLTMHREGLAP